MKTVGLMQTFIDNGNQVLRDVSVGLSRPGCIDVEQGAARNCLATKTHAIDSISLITQIDLDFTQRHAVVELSKGHCQELVNAGAIFSLVFGSVLGNEAVRRDQWREDDELRGKKLTLVNCGPLRANVKHLKP